MEKAFTSQPHFLPGYAGHCPQYRFRVGKTRGKLTHQLFIDPCVNHAPDLLVTLPPKADSLPSTNYPTLTERNTLLSRVRTVEPNVYQHPIIPGYDGHVPRFNTKIGQRFLAAASAGVVEHHNLMELYSCERRCVYRRDICAGGVGLFENKFRDRLQSLTKYQRPLLNVRVRSKVTTPNTVDHLMQAKNDPYTKFTVPHLLENERAEKYVIKGYCGHIPHQDTRYGETNMQQTHNALCEFTKRYHHRIGAEWCPMEDAGISSACSNANEFTIYPRSLGMIPTYAGHVPGNSFVIGMTFGAATVDAKNWLAKHKD